MTEVQAMVAVTAEEMSRYLRLEEENAQLKIALQKTVEELAAACKKDCGSRRHPKGKAQS